MSLGEMFHLTSILLTVTRSLYFRFAQVQLNTKQHKRFTLASGKFLSIHKNRSSILNCLLIVVAKTASASSVKDNPSNHVYYALIATVIILIVAFGAVVVFMWKKIQRSVKLHSQHYFLLFNLFVP